MRVFRICLLFCLALSVGLSLPPCLTDAVAAPAKTAARAKPAPAKKPQEAPAADRKTAAPAGARSVPTRITAENMTYEADARKVTFDHNVHVNRPDFDMWSNRLTVFLKPPKAKDTAQDGTSATDSLATGDIDYLVASGNVRMKRDKNQSTSDKATYTMDTAVLVLEGNPRLHDGENIITGEVVKYYMNENRSEVLGGAKKRVEAVFSTSDQPTREGAR